MYKAVIRRWEAVAVKGLAKSIIFCVLVLYNPVVTHSVGQSVNQSSSQSVSHSSFFFFLCNALLSVLVWLRLSYYSRRGFPWPTAWEAAPSSPRFGIMVKLCVVIAPRQLLTSPILVSWWPEFSERCYPLLILPSSSERSLIVVVFSAPCYITACLALFVQSLGRDVIFSFP